MDFIFEQVRTGGDRNFGYLVGDRAAGAGALIDPSYDPDALVERARVQGLEVSFIANTHGHVDHTGGNKRAVELTGAPVAAHETASPAAGMPLRDGSRLMLGSIAIEIFHVPGHAPDHILLFLPSEKIAITGDLIFVGKIGGTSSDADATAEFASLQRILAELPDETTIWPGHDYGCRASSTLRLEKANNPFLSVDGLEAFLELKKNWAAFKAQHGLK